MRPALFLLALTLHAQLPGPGVTPPVPTNRVAPVYPSSASREGMERSVVVEMLIDKSGTLTESTVLHPAGYGLDEAALSAVRQWRFQPATQGGKPVECRMSTEIQFKLLGRKQQLRRKYEFDTYNAALSDLANPATTAKAIAKIQALAQSNFAPAQYSEGVWRITGRYLPKDPEAGVKRLLAAVEQNYGPAVAQVGIYFFEGRYVTADKPKALQMLKSAAGQRIALAQLYLGELETEPLAGAFYYRQCALQKLAPCQSRLGEYFLGQPREHWPEAIAWLRLAAGQNYKPAQDLLTKHEPKLTDAERAQAAELRPMPSK